MTQIPDMTQVFDTMRSGLAIVTTAYRRKPAGCTTTWISRVSFEPPLVAVFLSPQRGTLEMIRKGKRFAINFLAEDGLALARQFGFSSGADKFADVQYETGQTGAPILRAAVSYLDCRLERIEKFGDHEMVLGKVQHAAIQRPDAPAVYDPATFFLNGERAESANEAHHG
ncbi:MAG: flavin reductase [Planctomycetales bacterium]|nr:flavin reductase [bacterium]UNM09044.1 MAG: flavin reductase [Planctomycetales bacterium]